MEGHFLGITTLRRSNFFVTFTNVFCHVLRFLKFFIYIYLNVFTSMCSGGRSVQKLFCHFARGQSAKCCNLASCCRDTCTRSHIPKTMCSYFTKFSVHICCCSGSSTKLLSKLEMQEVMYFRFCNVFLGISLVKIAIPDRLSSFGIQN